MSCYRQQTVYSAYWESQNFESFPLTSVTELFRRSVHLWRRLVVGDGRFGTMLRGRAVQDRTQAARLPTTTKPLTARLW